MEHKTQIYLDHAATTTTSVKVLSDMLPYCSNQYGNPSSLYSVGRNAHAVMDENREKPRLSPSLIESRSDTLGKVSTI